MALELYNTSAEKGLKPGSTGFCTVGMTAGMPEPMIRKLESLGGYRPAFDIGSPKASLNPPAFVHSQVNIGGRIYSVLSHICFAGADHQGRFNKLAHHIVLDPEERGAAGPAWVMLQAGIMAKQWTGEARILPAGKAMPDGPNPLMKCDTWKQVAGDAGWAGMLAQSFVLDSSRSAYVIYPPGTDILSLVNESIALLPERLRWQVSFNTYFDTLPAGLSWTWRFCLAGSPAAKAAPSHATSGVLIDLTASPGMAPDNIYVQMARTGQPAQESTASGISQTSRTIITPKPRQSSAKTTAPDFASETVQGQTADAEPIAGAAPQAQTAAAVQQDYYEPPAPPRRTPIFWAALLLWPILVLGGGGALLWSFQDHKPADDPPVGGTAVSELEEKLKKANKLAASRQKQLEDLGRRSQKDKKDAENRYNTLGKRATEADERARKAEKNVKELESKIAKLEKSDATTAAAPNKPRAGSDGNTNEGNNGGNGNSAPVNRGTPPSVDRSGGAEPIKLLSSNSRKTLGGEQEICKAPEGSYNVELIMPSALPEGFTTKKENRKFTVTYNMADELGTKENHLLITLEIKDGKIIATRKGISISGDPSTQIRRLEELLRYAIMRVCDSRQKELLTRWFNKVENADLALTKFTATRDLKIPFETLNPVVTITANGIWKTVKGQGTATPIARTNSGAELELTLLLEKTENGTSFTAKWGKGSSVREITMKMKDLVRKAREEWEKVRKNAQYKGDWLTQNTPRPPGTTILQIHDKLLPNAAAALKNPKLKFRQKRKKAHEDFARFCEKLPKKGKIGHQKIDFGQMDVSQKTTHDKLKGTHDAYITLEKSLGACKTQINNILNEWKGMTKQMEDVKKYAELPVTIEAKGSGLVLAKGIVKVGKK